MCLYLSPPARGSTVGAFSAAAPFTVEATEEVGVSGAEEVLLSVEAGVGSSDAGFESGVAVSTAVALVEFPATVDVTVPLASAVATAVEEPVSTTMGSEAESLAMVTNGGGAQCAQQISGEMFFQTSIRSSASARY